MPIPTILQIQSHVVFDRVGFDQNAFGDLSGRAHDAGHFAQIEGLICRG